MMTISKLRRRNDGVYNVYWHSLTSHFTFYILEKENRRHSTFDESSSIMISFAHLMDGSMKTSWRFPGETIIVSIFLVKNWTFGCRYFPDLREASQTLITWQNQWNLRCSYWYTPVEFECKLHTLVSWPLHVPSGIEWAILRLLGVATESVSSRTDRSHLAWASAISAFYLAGGVMNDRQKFRCHHIHTLHDRLFELGDLHLDDVLERFVGREQTATEARRDQRLIFMQSAERNSYRKPRIFLMATTVWLRISLSRNST